MENKDGGVLDVVVPIKDNVCKLQRWVGSDDVKRSIDNLLCRIEALEARIKESGIMDGFSFDKDCLQKEID